MEEINAESGVHGADTLIAGDEADRYLVRRAAPEGKSYAMKIADKYGFTLDVMA